MWVQVYQEEHFHDLKAGQVVGYASTEQEAEEYVDERPFLYVLFSEGSELLDNQLFRKQWPSHEIWAVIADEYAKEWFQGKPHLCAKCTQHDCTTPEIMRYVVDCEDYAEPRDVRYQGPSPWSPTSPP